MEPTIPVGSIVFTQPVATDSIGPDQIVAFTSPIKPSETILHRVIEITEVAGATVMRTKGDANNNVDNWTVTPNAIQGSYTFYIPYLGHVAAFMQTPVGFAILVGVPVLILIILQIKHIKAGIEEEVSRRTALASSVVTKAPVIKKRSRKSKTLKMVLLSIIGTSLVVGHSTHTITALVSDQTQLQGLTITAEFESLAEPNNFARFALQLSPSVDISQQDSDHLQFDLTAIGDFDSYTYTITYGHLVEGDIITEAITGSEPITAPDISKNDIYLGTCSEDGLVCVPHVGIQDVQITIELSSDTEAPVTLEDQLSTPWVEESNPWVAKTWRWN